MKFSTMILTVNHADTMHALEDLINFLSFVFEAENKIV